DEGVHPVNERHVARQADITHVETSAIVITGRPDFAVGMLSAVGIEAAKIDERGIELAALEPRQELVAAGEEMVQAIAIAPGLIEHQNRVAEGGRFDAELEAVQVIEAFHRLVLSRGQYHRQRRVEHGAGRNERAELDAAPTIRGRGTVEIRHACRWRARLSEG